MTNMQPDISRQFSNLTTRCVGAVIALALTAFATNANAALRIEVNKGQVRGIPVAVVPFGVEGTTSIGQDVAAIIEADLTNSGRFDPIPRSDHLSAPSRPEDIKFKDFRLLKAEAMVVGSVVQTSPGTYAISYHLYDVFQGAEGQLSGFRYQDISERSLRRVAHKISDEIYEKLTGVRGAFDTKLAYVARNGPVENRINKLVVSDYDGDTTNGGTIFETNALGGILSPAWSPDGQALAYLNGADSNFGWELSVHYVYEDRRQVLFESRSAPSAPAWSPDGSMIAFATAADGGNREIFVVNVATGARRRLTDNLAIDTQPSWFPDGTRLAFTSNRSGKPQIYEISANGGQASRLTFDGKEEDRRDHQSG